MKHNLKHLFGVVILLTAMFAACKKDTTPFYANGMRPVLTSSATTVAVTPADSLSTAFVLKWTNPHYATDSATEKYTIQIDTSSAFATPVNVVVSGALLDSFTAKQINTIALGFGFSYNVAGNLNVRIVSSYANNNEQLASSNPNVLNITPYVVPPKVMPPINKVLFITGSATAGGWQAGGGSGVPIPAQQFTEVDSVLYQGTFYLNGGQQYLLLPVNGDWTNKYAVADNTVAGIASGGSFGYNLNDNFVAPAATGMYTITLDFQHGTFTVVPVAIYGLMYVPGDYQGWSPATAPALGAPKNDGNFDGYINIPAGGTYQFKFTPAPNWTNSYGDGGNGTLSPTGGNVTVGGPGYYHVTVSTVSNTWSATATTWSVIGSFAASGWSNDIEMTYNSGSNSWSATITTAAGDQFKFRANNDWTLNYGDDGGLGSLDAGGANIGDPTHNQAITPGTHIITLYLGGSGYYTYMIQ